MEERRILVREKDAVSFNLICALLWVEAVGLNRKKLHLKVLVQWYTPIISTTQEAEIRKIMVQDQSGKKVRETPVSTNNLSSQLCGSH
jgi:hypothetical protein